MKLVLLEVVLQKVAAELVVGKLLVVAKAVLSLVVARRLVGKLQVDSLVYLLVFAVGLGVSLRWKLQPKL